MNLRTWVALFAAGGVLITASPGLAQSAPPPSASAPANAKSEALVRRYLVAIRFEKLLDTMMGSILPVIAESAARENPNITADQRQIIVDTVRETMRETFVPQMIDRIVPVYATTFSQSELEVRQWPREPSGPRHHREDAELSAKKR